MTLRGVLLAGFAAGLAVAACPAARAQETPPAAEPEAEAEAPADDTNITNYPPSFFAPYNASTARDMLNWIPGFSFDGGSGARGFAGTAGNVLIDGQRPPSRGDSLGSILSRIPASSVERIDIVRGGAGGLDMQGRSIIANVIRKKEESTKGAVNLTATAYDDSAIYRRANLELQRRSGERTFDGSLAIDGADGPQMNNRIRRGPAGELIRLSTGTGDYHPRSYVATGVVETPFAAGQLRLNLRLSRQTNHNTFNELLIVPGGMNVERFVDHNTQGEIGARYTRTLGEALSLEAVAFQRLSGDDYFDEFDTPDFTSRSTLHNRSGESIGNGKLVWRAGPKWTYETGVEAAYNLTDQQQGFFFNGGDLDLAGQISTVDELRTEGFVTATWQARSTLSVESGVRYEYSTITAKGSAGDAQNRLGYLKPRLVVSWTPKPQHQFLLRLEKTVDQLSFDSFAASASFSNGTFGVGNSSIRPQQTFQALGRYQYSFGRQGSLVVTYTHQQLTDLVSSIIVFLPSSGGGSSPFGLSINVPHATREILEANFSLPLDDLGFKGAVLSVGDTWRHSSVIDPITFTDRRVGGDRPYQWNVSLTQTLNNPKIVWNLRASGQAKSRGFSAQQLNYNYDDVHFFASMAWTVRPDTTITVGANSFTAGHGYNGYLLFSGPRSLSPLTFAEENQSRIRRQYYLLLRRTF